MGERIVVYTLVGSRRVLDHDLCVFLDRTLTVRRKQCEWKALNEYTGGPTGTGVMMARPREDLVLGSAIHEGLRLLLLGGSLKGACAAAWNYMLEAAAKGLTLQDDEHLWTALPDVAMMLVKEQAALAYMLVAAFGKRKLAPFLAKYEVLGVEQEINWLLGIGPDGKHYVMMSRPDAIVREYETGAILPVSFKSLKTFEASTKAALRSDPQFFTEGLAAQAAYGGEPPKGGLYVHFIKDLKSKDSDLNDMKRLGSRLVRPWIPRETVGQPMPSDFRMEWNYYDPKSFKTSSLSSKWRRFNVWEDLNGGLEQWLEWLDQGIIDTRHEQDWLDVKVKETEVRWNAGVAERWVMGQQGIEEAWREKLVKLERARKLLSPGAAAREEARLFSRNESACQTFKKDCMFYRTCWGNELGQFTTVQEDLDKGRFVPRDPNHYQEEEVDFDD